jgi:hypothetical protein
VATSLRRRRDWLGLRIRIPKPSPRGLMEGISMFLRKTRLRVPALLLAALAALLVTAAAASAETRTGESTTPFNEASVSPEATLVKGTASFETASGAAVFTATTAAPPTGEGGLATALTTTECTSNPTSLEEADFSIFTSSPLFAVETLYGHPEALAITGTIKSPQYIAASKTVSGATTTISVTSSTLAEAGFRCAVIVADDEAHAASVMAFPIKAPPPPPVPAPALAPAPAPAPLPAPAVLSVAKPKPLKVKAKTWKTVHVKVSNTGATATTQGSLRVKAAKGVLVKPEVQKLPVLTPGATFTLSVRVRLGQMAKPTSTLPVTVTAPGVTGTGSIVLKLKQ